MSEPLRICMVTTFYPPYNFGGDGIWVYRLTHALARRGHRLSVVFNPEAYRMMGGEVHEDAFPSLPGIELVPLEPQPLGVIDTLVAHQLGRPFGHGRQMADYFDQNKFDVVHFHNISLVGGPGALAYGNGLKFCTMNDHWFVCAMHILWRFNREPCSRRTCLACTLAGRRPPQLWRYTNVLEKAVRHVDLFFTPSESAVRTHQANHFPAPLQKFPYFIPQEEADAAQGSWEHPHPRRYFLFVGRLEKMKGVQDLLDVFETFRDADLLIIGTGTYQADLEARASRLPHVHMLGFRSPKALHAYYFHAIATLVPSIGYETFGWTSLESMVHKTPVIAHDFGPLPEVLKDGGGLVYQDSASLRAGLEKFSGQPEVAKQYGELGYQNYLKNFSESVHVERYAQIVADLKAGKK